MRPFIEVGVIIAALGSAMFWFRSAMCRLPSVKPSTDEVKDHHGIIQSAAKNEQIEFLGRRTDGRSRLVVSVG